VAVVTNVVSVITPVHASTAEHISQAYESLSEQELPGDWEWEWLVQEDGQTGNVTAMLPADKRISVGMGRQGGPGVARTLALARASGSLVKVLDADDMLTSGVLRRDIAILTENPEIEWTTSRVLDLLPDGSTLGFENDPPPGPLVGTAVLRHWQEHKYRAPVHPATLCIRRSTLLALGGWMALPASEDTGLLISASVISNGYFIPEVGLYYRKWPGQSTRQAAHLGTDEYAWRMRVIEDRAAALLALGSGKPWHSARESSGGSGH
jgi:glycosyltransferase involved in cell wall biosynthesis